MSDGCSVWKTLSSSLCGFMKPLSVKLVCSSVHEYIKAAASCSHCVSCFRKIRNRCSAKDYNQSSDAFCPTFFQLLRMHHPPPRRRFCVLPESLITDDSFGGVRQLCLYSAFLHAVDRSLTLTHRLGPGLKTLDAVSHLR